LIAAIALTLAFVVALAIGTFTRRAGMTALLLMGFFVGALALLAGAGRALLIWGPALGLVGGLVLESIRDTARALRPFDTVPARPRQERARRDAARRAA
jgi:hypothetical protein